MSEETTEAPESCDLLLYQMQLARVGHLRRVCENARVAYERAFHAYIVAARDLALVTEGMAPGFDGDKPLERAREKADGSPQAPVVFREHPIEAMFRKGQLRPEWRCLFDRYVDLCEMADGGSAGVIDWERTVVQVSAVPEFSARQLEAVQEKERAFLGPIKRAAGERALAVFDITHRFGKRLNSVMSVSQLGADGRFGRRKTVGQLLQRAYEALADHHGVTAARARQRYFRDGDRPLAQIINPLTADERAEIEANRQEDEERERRREAQRFQQGKAHAAGLQRQRRAGDRPGAPLTSEEAIAALRTRVAAQVPANPLSDEYALGRRRAKG